MEHRKLEGLMSPMEKVARVASGGLRAADSQTSPSGAISLDNADGTRTIIGEVSNGEDNPSYTMATHVGDTTPPGIPTGITATSRSGVVVVEWDGTLSGGIPDDFFCVRIYLDNVELGALSEAGSVASAKLESGTTHSITATSEDDCCLPDGTPAHNVSEATQAISVTVAKDASEVMADIDEQIEGVEQEIADFKANTYTKAETDKKVQDLDDEISTELTTNYYNKTQIDTSYATKTLVSQTKDEIELSASQTYANKGAGNPNLSPFYAHDLSDVYDATDNPDGYWTETPARATQLDDGWAHIVLDNSSGTGTMYSRTYIRPMAEVPDNATLLIEMRNLDTDVTSTTEDPRLWFNPNLTNSQLGGSVCYVMEDGDYRVALTKNEAASPTHFARWWWGISKGRKAEFDARISVYASETATIDGQQVTLPYEGSFKPYVTDQRILGKTYATNSALTVGLDGIRQEVASEYQSIDAMGAYSTTAEMNTAIQTSATGIEQSVAATYSTKQATADAIAAIQVGGRNLITLEETVNGYVNANTGVISSPGASQERTSGLIPVTPGETYICQDWCVVTSSQQAWAMISWYASDESYIGGTATFGTAGVGYAIHKAVAPDNAAYARASWRTFGNGRGKLEQGTLPTDYTQAPEDIVARPNLTPFGSHDLTDVYNATTNPEGYWRQRPAAAYVTQLADGWLHFERANSGTGVVGSSMQIRPIPGVEPGELLTVLIEVRNNQSTAISSTGNFDDLYIQQGNNFQLWGTTVQSSSLTNNAQAKPLSALGESFEMRFTKAVDSAHKTDDYIVGFAINIRNGAGQTLSFDFRVSVYRGGYGGGYVPYSIEDTTLSKTYTKSSTFTQTINGLDGRITATEDGVTLLDTLIRLFQGGVLAGYVGNAVSALMNAAGSFDVVQTTWQDGEPTIVDTLATFGANLVEIGKNGLTTVIKMVGGLLEIKHVVDSSYRTGGYSEISSQQGMVIDSADTASFQSVVPSGNTGMAEFVSKVEGTATASGLMGNFKSANLIYGISSPDESLGPTRMRIASLSAEDSQNIKKAEIQLAGFDGGASILSDGVTEIRPNGGTVIHTSASSSKLGNLRVGSENTTEIRGIFFGSKIINPNGAAYGVLFTQAECVSKFGRALDNNKDVVLVLNGDSVVYGGQMTASLNGSSEVRVYMSPTRSGATRINYLVVLGA